MRHHMMCVVAVVLLAAITSAPAYAGDLVEAEYNFSSYEIEVVDQEGVTTLFVDYIDRDGNVLGQYNGYAVVLLQGEEPIVLEGVIVIAVAAIRDHTGDMLEPSKVYWHEHVHHRQASRLGYWEYATKMANQKRACECESAPLEVEAQNDPRAIAGTPRAIHIGSRREPVAGVKIMLH